MNTKKKVVIAATLLTATLMFVAITGCEKEQPAATTQQQQTEMPKVDTEGAIAAVDEQVEQKICPVMEGAINKEIYTEYKGQKIYFCCKGCAEIFHKDPEKYLAKLPQFQE